MHMKTRWMLSAGSVLLLVVALLMWGQFAPRVVAASLERTILAKLNEPVPLGSGKGVGRWHWEGYEQIPWGVKLMSLELRSESGGEKVFRAEEVTVTQQSKGVVVALARWNGAGGGVVRGQGAYAETLVRSGGVLQDIRLHDVKLSLMGSRGGGLTTSPEISAGRISIGALDRANGANGIRATDVAIRQPKEINGYQKITLGGLEIDRIGPDGFPRRMAATRLTMHSSNSSSDTGKARPLVEMISLVANAAPDPLSLVKIMVADIHGVPNVEAHGKAAAELRAEIMEAGKLSLQMAAHRASSGLRAHFQITFMGGRSLNFADLAQEIRVSQLAPMITLAEIELHDAGAQMRSNPDWQQPKEAIRVGLLKAGMISKSSAPAIYNWLYMPPGDARSSHSLRLSGEMVGGKLMWRVISE